MPRTRGAFRHYSDLAEAHNHRRRGRGRPRLCRRPAWEVAMTVARVTTITAGSPTSFDDAVRGGLERASRTLRGITGLRIVEQKAKIDQGRIQEYRVTMELTFILEG